MTLAYTIIKYQFWFEYGLGKAGLYLGVINLGLLITTMFTVKGIYIPVWMFIPLGIVVVFVFIGIGYFLDTRNVLGRLISHQNRKGRNPEFGKLCEDVERMEERMDRIEAKIDALLEKRGL